MIYHYMDIPYLEIILESLYNREIMELKIFNCLI
jgi:hypothetical protein